MCSVLPHRCVDAKLLANVRATCEVGYPRPPHVHTNMHVTTDAIHERTEWREVLDLLESGRKIVVCQTAPAVRVAIGEEFGLAPGTITTGQLVAAQRKLGFKYVFDTVRRCTTRATRRMTLCDLVDV